jgi:predicted O-methyltransferase YrrM
MFIRKAKTYVRLIRNLEHIPDIDKKLAILACAETETGENRCYEVAEELMRAIQVERSSFEKSFAMMIEDFRQSVLGLLNSDGNRNALVSDSFNVACPTVRKADGNEYPREVTAASSMLGSTALVNLRATIISAFHSIFGAERADNYSKSLSADGFAFFDEVIRQMTLGVCTRYLEIGSFEGVSMVVIATLLKQHGHMIYLTSIDPYPADGYWEDNPVFGRRYKVADKKIKQAAFDFYEAMDLSVNHIEDVSSNALIELLRQNRSYDLIYVDGHHEKTSPLVDIALSLMLIRSGGVIVVDDWIWPDVLPIEELLDRHLIKIAEHPQMVAYKRAD